MKSRFVVYGLSILAAAVISIIFSLFAPIKVFGVNFTPNVLLLFTLCMGFTQGAVTGCVIGGICGLIYDVSSPFPVGTTVLIFLLLGLFMGFISTKLNNENTFLLIVFVAISAIAYEVLTFHLRYLAYFIEYGFADYGAFFVDKLSNVIIGTTISNVLLALMFRWLLFGFFTSIARKNKQLRFRGNV